MNIVLNLTFSITAGVLSIVALYYRNPILVVIIAVYIIGSYFIERSYGKLNGKAWLSNLLFAIIGAISFWFLNR